MYRYRDNSGTTRLSLIRSEQVIEKLGDLQYVRGYVYNGRHGLKHTGVLVRGTQGTARFSGFGWGYSGEGPRGLQTFLRKLNVSLQECQMIANIHDHMNDVGPVWKINLSMQKAA